jgi:hypothetical protein
LGLGTDGSQTTEYVSTTAGVTVVGLADEELAAVEVEVLIDGVLHTNGALALVVGANSRGGFVAERIDLGIVDGTLLPGLMTVTVFDRAMNPAIPLDLSWRQVGASGPGAALPGGGDITVRVFDVTTEQPVNGALVFSHEVNVRETFLNGGVTDATGATLVPSGAVGATVVTVDAPGYDLFTFHGVPTTRLDVPLRPTNPNIGQIFFTVTSELSSLADPSVAVRIADDRMIEGPIRGPLSCTDSPFGVLCATPGAGLRSGRFGTPTLLATVDQDPLSFTPDSYLKVAHLEFLTEAAAPGGKLSMNYEVEGFLSDVGVDAEERPLWAPMAILDATLLSSFDPTSLIEGSPRVLIEGAIPSLGSTAIVGAGIADEIIPGTLIWTVQGAFAGAADGVSDNAEDLLGRWVSGGLIEAELLLRVDMEDTAGNVTGRRVRFSDLSGAPLFAVPDVPELQAPVFATGGSAFELEFDDTLDDTHDGLYEVHMTDSLGRSWDVWRLDEPGSGGTITAHVPEIELFGGQPLADGPLSVVVSLRALPTADFDPGAFLWGEVAARADARAHTAPTGLQQP